MVLQRAAQELADDFFGGDERKSILKSIAGGAPWNFKCKYEPRARQNDWRKTFHQVIVRYSNPAAVGTRCPHSAQTVLINRKQLPDNAV